MSEVPLQGLRFWDSSLGFRASGSVVRAFEGFGGWGATHRLSGCAPPWVPPVFVLGLERLGCGVWCLVFGVWCLVFGVWGLEFDVWEFPLRPEAVPG